MSEVTPAARLAGRVAVVTGASRGIGAAIARRLVAEGAQVVITARGLPDLTAMADELGGPERAVAVAGKADDPDHRAAALRAAVDTFGGLDVMINNTGINPVAGPMTEASAESLAKTFAVNVGAAIGWVGAAQAAGLGRRPGAAVVNVASVAGLTPAPPIGVYGASKAALVHATAQLALELAPRVRVNAVAPAVVRTAFATALYEGREDAVLRGYPLGRLGEPEDIAAAVAFLASDDAAWITGQTVVLDGGAMLRTGLIGS